MFNVDSLHNKLETNWLGSPFIYHECVNSTNTYVKQLTPKQASHGLVCLADYQTAGRGQYKRSWYSEPGANLTFSMVLKPQVNERLQALCLVTAFTLSEVLEQHVSQCIQIRWPNDLYFMEKKLAGLLVESVFNGNKLDRFIIGIGLNVNQKKFDPSLKDAAISLAQINGKGIFCREQLLADFLMKFEANFTDWEKNDVELIRKVNRKLIGYGKKMYLSLNGEKLPDPCKILGINEKGYLTVLDENMSIITYTYQQVRIEDVA